MQKSKPKYACLLSKIVEVWIDRFASVMIDDVVSVPGVIYIRGGNTRNGSIYKFK